MTREPTEMELRAAEALHARFKQGVSWREIPQANRDYYLRQARVVMRAMREPTPEMGFVAHGTGIACCLEFDPAFRAAWEIAIDAASPPEGV